MYLRTRNIVVHLCIDYTSLAIFTAWCHFTQREHIYSILLLQATVNIIRSSRRSVQWQPHWYMRTDEHEAIFTSLKTNMSYWREQN